MKKILKIFSTILNHPQPIAFILFKFIGVRLSSKFFYIRRNGYSLHLDNNDMSLSLFHKGKKTYEWMEILLKRSLASEDCFIDIGGSIGIHSIFAKKIVNKGRVIMAEPMPALVDAARRNFELNNVDIELIPKAITIEEGSIEMIDLQGRSFIKNDSSIYAKSANEATIVNGLEFSNEIKDKISIDACSLDFLTAEIHKINLLKIDTEGAEIMTLRSGPETLKKTQTVLVGLFNPYTTSRFNYEAKEAAQYLLDIGFINSFRISDNNGLVLSKLKKKPLSKLSYL